MGVMKHPRKSIMAPKLWIFSYLNISFPFPSSRRCEHCLIGRGLVRVTVALCVGVVVVVVGIVIDIVPVVVVIRIGDNEVNDVKDRQHESNNTESAHIIVG